MTKRRILRSFPALVLAAAFLLGTVPARAAASSEIQDELDGLTGQQSDIQEQMNNIQSAIDGLDYEQANLLEKKAILDQKNLLAQQELAVIEEQIAIVDGLLGSVQSDLTEAREEQEAQRQRWLTRVRAMEESSGVSYLEVVFDAANFSDLLTRLDLVNEVVAYDEQLVADYIAARENVESLEAEAETMFAENELRRQELEAKKAQLETDVDAAAQLMESLRDNIDDYKLLMDQAALQEAAIKDLIAEKKVELADALAVEQTANQAGVTNGGGFIWPSYTKWRTSDFGMRFHPIQHVWTGHKGVDIGAAYGSAAWAAASGTVITASYGWNGGYGNYVMVMHPNGYTTLYAHLSSIAVTSGQTVSQGETVGYVGSTGNSTGPHLHFEIRDSSGTPMDPMGFAYP